MPVSVKIRKVDEVTVVDMFGRLEVGEAVQTLRAALQSAMDEGAVRFVLNLENVSYIDSAALGELVTFYTIILRKQGEIRLLTDKR